MAIFRRATRTSVSKAAERPAVFLPGDGLNPGHLWIVTNSPGGPETWEVVQDEYGVRLWFKLSSESFEIVAALSYGAPGSGLATLNLQVLRGGQPLPSANVTLIVDAPTAQVVAISLNPGSPAGSWMQWHEPNTPGSQVLALLKTGVNGHVVVDLQSATGVGSYQAQGADGLWSGSAISFP